MKRFFTALYTFAFLMLGLTHASASSVVVIELEGPIGPVLEEHIVEGIREANQAGASLIVLEIDTPGGLATSMRGIISSILDSDVPVASYVSPTGARAASAGAFILYASHIAAMAPTTNLGSATPVAIGGSVPASQEETPGIDEKVINDSVAYIEGLAELRGRNKEWAKKFVTEAGNIGYTQAFDEGVIEYVAKDVDDLLQQVNGKTVRVKDKDVTLAVSSAVVEEIEEDWRTEFLKVITNPNIAYFLLLIGVYALMYEVTHPGLMLPGVVGAICLLLGLYAMSLLPINYAGLGLIFLGLAFLIGEAFFPSFGILGFGGIIAFVVGSILLVDSSAPSFQISRGLIAGMAISSGGFVFLITSLVVRSMARKGRTGQDALINKPAKVLAWDGEKGKVKVQGETWNAVSKDPLMPGQQVTITKIEGLKLSVTALNSGDN